MSAGWKRHMPDIKESRKKSSDQKAWQKRVPDYSTNHNVSVELKYWLFINIKISLNKKSMLVNFIYVKMIFRNVTSILTYPTSSRSSLSACRCRNLDFNPRSCFLFSCRSLHVGFLSSHGSIDSFRLRNSCLRIVKFCSMEASLWSCFCTEAITVATRLASLPCTWRIFEIWENIHTLKHQNCKLRW